MYINVRLDGYHHTRALADSGCHCFSSISERFVRRKGISTVDIVPRELEQVTEQKGSSVQITQIARFLLDIDGFETPIVGYVVPGQRDDLILGLGWMERRDVTLHPRKGYLMLRNPTKTKVRTRALQSDRTFLEVSAHAIRACYARDRKRQRKGAQATQIYSITLHDIQKALQRKVYADPRKLAPEWLWPVIDAFDRKKAQKLPEHRKGKDHEINLERDQDGKEKEVPAMPLYGMSKEQLLVLRKTLDELLDQGFIRASRSSAGAPVIFVRKPGGGLRFCVDYRGLNAITKKDRYPLPLIGETLRMIASAKWVSKVDVISAFHRIRIRAGDEWKTTFRSRLGSYEWLVTPFGLCGAPASFQRYINDVLQPWLDISCSAYLDDVIIFSNGTRAEHRELVKAIVGALGAAGLQLDIEKSCFEAKSIKYLGYIIDVAHGIRVDPDKVHALREWQAPTSVRGVRGFVGFANFYRQFIDGFSEIVRPLTELTRTIGNTGFAWSQACQTAFDTLRKALMEAPVLAQ